MNKTKKRGQPEYNRNYDIGDLVSLHGSDGVIYRVEGYREVNEVNADEAPMGYTEYYVSNAENDDDWWDMAYDEDMVLLARAEDAKKFLRNSQARKRDRVRKGGRTPLITDDLLADLHSYIEIRKSLQPGPMFNVMGEMIKTVKSALKRKTGGGADA